MKIFAGASMNTWPGASRNAASCVPAGASPVEVVLWLGANVQLVRVATLSATTTRTSRGYTCGRVAAMLKLALAAFLFAACSKAAPDPAKTPVKDPATGPRTVEPMKGPTAEMFDPAKLPAAGTAPPPVAVTKELDPMWYVPIKTLKGEPTTLAAYKGKALMLVNVASQCGNTPQFALLVVFLLLFVVLC